MLSFFWADINELRWILQYVNQHHHLSFIQGNIMQLKQLMPAKNKNELNKHVNKSKGVIALYKQKENQ